MSTVFKLGQIVKWFSFTRTTLKGKAGFCSSELTMEHLKLTANNLKTIISLAKTTFPLNVETFKINRQRLLVELNKTFPSGLVLLKGGTEIPQYNTDTEYAFRQESFFLWTFGVQEPGYWGAVNVDTGLSYLFMPRFDENYKIWMGDILQPSDVQNKYKVDHVYYEDEVEAVINTLKPKVLLLLKGTNSDSNLEILPPVIKNHGSIPIDDKQLFTIMSELRVVKNPLELELLRKANLISSFAHKIVMRNIRVAHYEYQAEAVFKYWVQYIGGCRSVAYNCICGSGHNASVLHYGHAAAPNLKRVTDNDICLFDMGASLYGYASDITCSFPASGKFTPDQKIVYESVLAARNAALDAIKPGVPWIKVHEISGYTLLKELVRHKLLKGDPEEMAALGLWYYFQPHGLGHLMGIDVHDAGGYNERTPPRRLEPQYKSLRTARTLHPGMVMTVEPGCYFIDFLLEKAKKDNKISKYFNIEELDRFMNFGGVRIEDDIVVTETGYEMLTDVPRTVEEIEQWMSNDIKEHDMSEFMKHGHEFQRPSSKNNV